MLVYAVPAVVDRNHRETRLDVAGFEPPHRLGQRNDTVTRFEQPLHARAECLRAHEKHRLEPCLVAVAEAVIGEDAHAVPVSPRAMRESRPAQVLRKAVFMGLPVATAVPPLAFGQD